MSFIHLIFTYDWRHPIDIHLLVASSNLIFLFVQVEGRPQEKGRQCVVQMNCVTGDIRWATLTLTHLLNYSLANELSPHSFTQWLNSCGPQCPIPRARVRRWSVRDHWKHRRHHHEWLRDKWPHPYYSTARWHYCSVHDEYEWCLSLCRHVPRSSGSKWARK